MNELVSMLAGGLATVAILLAKTVYEKYTKGEEGAYGDSMRPPKHMRALTKSMADAQEKAMLSRRVEEIHAIVTDKDPDGVPRVHNKRMVETAIMQSRDALAEQTPLLRSILKELEKRR